MFDGRLNVERCVKILGDYLLQSLHTPSKPIKDDLIKTVTPHLNNIPQIMVHNLVDSQIAWTIIRSNRMDKCIRRK